MSMKTLGLALTATILATAPAAADETVIIGLDGIMTGPNAQNGEYVRNGATLAVNQINADGGITLPDGTKATLALEVVDDQAKPDIGLNAIRKLVSNPDVVAFLGPDYSGITFPTLFVGEEAGIAQITSSIAAKITQSGYHHIFRGRSNDEQWMKALIDYAIKDRSLDKIGLSFTNIELGRSGHDVALEHLAEAYDMKPVVVTSHSFGDKDMTASAAQIAQADPELLINWGTQIEAALLLRDLRSLGWDGVFAFNAADDIFVNLAGAQAEGVIGPQNWVWTKDDPASRDFAEAYKETYGNLPSPHSVIYYDGVRLIADAASKAGDDRSAILDELHAMDEWQGAQGTYQPSIEGGNMIDDTVIIEYDADLIPRVVKSFQ